MDDFGSVLRSAGLIKAWLVQYRLDKPWLSEMVLVAYLGDVDSKEIGQVAFAGDSRTGGFDLSDNGLQLFGRPAENAVGVQDSCPC